ncbi:MAG: M20/M25/M40 family metallo-hydrolase [Bacteroidetes bacterium]|nr:M20/M25/M40 family metallo-hydrolase [Cryomorphaceae bacterium]MBL6677666.1 M20/M25/M40 family metallo-hydrolase [Flavobacteriaceae bacterium]MDA0330824.1 M20/M25/M40 family metallo-hydrolase [Bacteroidota bacterium]MDA0885541.1 M20/M25/M40 family metallo-hydrolase [Bacteroidota bacterium]MDA1225559.1 M20/M25/M40 family metallo-hydrolase [Bacteroidota bacterium]
MRPFIILLLTLNSINSQTTQENSSFIDKIYDEALSNGKSYQWLDYLSNQIGGRLSGSINYERSVKWGKEELDLLEIDSVWLQPVMVPKWVRGAPEYAHIETRPGNNISVPIAALGGSISTPSIGISANVVEVKSFKELRNIGKDSVSGKIVFFNRPMDVTLINTFQAYSESVNQRTQGAVEAAKLGAIGVIVRSMTTTLDNYPHTGSMYYEGLSLSQRIPAASISTNGAELLSSMLSLNPKIKFFFRQNSKNFPDVLTHSVIGEIRGSEKPNEIIVVGGHLDSWDLGDGSHDDGAGIVQSMEVLRIFKSLNYIPKRTIRVVLFANEENGLRGGNKYAEVARLKNEKHFFAIESDAGGFTPRSISFDTSDKEFKNLTKFEDYFKDYGVSFLLGGSGADINPLKDGNIILAGLRPDPQRYFDYHHAASDTFDKINKRELELGAAAMASLIYLMDNYKL